MALTVWGCGDSGGSSGSAPVAGEYICGAGSGSSADPYVVCSAEDLDRMRENLSGTYLMLEDITLTEVWIPVGTAAAPFTGTFDGGGKKITGLSVNFTGDYAGLFGYINGGKVTRLTVQTGVNGVNGSNYVGGIAGRISNGSITECGVTGTFSGRNYIGAVAGYAYNSVITNCFSGGTVTGDGLIGGITGRLRAGSTLSNSYSTAEIHGQNSIGGVVGEVNGSSIWNAYATGSVHGINTTSVNAGGIAGSSLSGSVTNCVALGNQVTAIRYVGHVVGYISGSTVESNYALTLMAIWGQEDADPFTHLAAADAALLSTYEILGWAFGDNSSAPWKQGAGYPQLYFE